MLHLRILLQTCILYSELSKYLHKLFLGIKWHYNIQKIHVN